MPILRESSCIELYPEGQGPFRVDPILGEVISPGQKPIWTTTEPHAVLEQYKAISLLKPETHRGTGIEHITVVAAFPLESLRSDLDFVYLRSGESAIGACVSKGRVPPRELAGWR